MSDNDVKKNKTETHIYSHNQRKNSDDVNPLLIKSNEKIDSKNDNFIVGKRQSGKLVNLSEKSSASLIERAKQKLTDDYVNYYEVDKKQYSISKSYSFQTSQSTLYFDVCFNFYLKVKDPCPIVENNITSLLSCIDLQLRRFGAETSSKYSVAHTNDAKSALQQNFDVFLMPDYLQFTPGLVEVSPDKNAIEYLRNIEGRDIKIQSVGADSAVNTAIAVGSVIEQKVPLQIEDHHINKLLPVDGYINSITSDKKLESN